MFGDPATNPAQWPSTLLGDIIDGTPQNGLFKKESFYGRGVKIAWVENVSGYELNSPNMRCVELTENEERKYSLAKGEVLVTRSSHLGVDGVGLMTVVSDESREIIAFESHIMRIKVKNHYVNPYYLVAYFRTDHGRKLIAQKAKRSTMSTINQPDLMRLRVLIPPLELQRRIEPIIKKSNRYD
jgi:type I restriction enzyme, S subunit